MYIPRHLHHMLTKLIAQFPAVMVTGARQVGKSTLLQHTAREQEERYDYVTFDDPIRLEQAQDDPMLFMMNHSGRLVLDEVQYAPKLFSVLKLHIDEKKQNGLFLLSGSQAFSLMEHVNESLAGRVAVLRLLGLSYREIRGVEFFEGFVPTEAYLKAYEFAIDRQEQTTDDKSSPDTLWQMIHKGQMPRLYEQETHWEVYYASYVSTYLQRDVRHIANIRDLNDFTRFMTAVAARSGELLNYNNIAQEVGVSVDTIKRWIAILETSGIVYLLKPYHHNHLKRAIKTPKIYMLDTGLMAYLTKWLTPEVLQHGAKNGQFFESFVVAEILKSFYNQGAEPPVYFYRDTNQKEIDIIIEQDGIIYPVEIKMTAKPTKKHATHFNTLKEQLPADEIGIGTGVIINQYPNKLWLDKELVALPVGYL
ncbi:ATP-binding protein [Moraxella lacunata]|uniref:ATPase n=1 Tax=Moraxella lacunata TaxID=477 RepID=A0A1V4GYN5_MORLA|nr:ATP-binding protein [Moraxella lacunata]OPH37754.1 ATPase [Moraxella lacunata]